MWQVKVSLLPPTHPTHSHTKEVTSRSKESGRRRNQTRDQLRPGQVGKGRHFWLGLKPRRCYQNGNLWWSPRDFRSGQFYNSFQEGRPGVRELGSTPVSYHSTCAPSDKSLISLSLNFLICKMGGQMK